jgi:hypothetical protein
MGLGSFSKVGIQLYCPPGSYQSRVYFGRASSFPARRVKMVPASGPYP